MLGLRRYVRGQTIQVGPNDQLSPLLAICKGLVDARRSDDQKRDLVHQLMRINALLHHSAKPRVSIGTPKPSIINPAQGFAMVRCDTDAQEGGHAIMLQSQDC
jgi:hypothetical protein